MEKRSNFWMLCRSPYESSEFKYPISSIDLDASPRYKTEDYKFNFHRIVAEAARLKDTLELEEDVKNFISRLEEYKDELIEPNSVGEYFEKDQFSPSCCDVNSLGKPRRSRSLGRLAKKVSNKKPSLKKFSSLEAPELLETSANNGSKEFVKNLVFHLNISNSSIPKHEEKNSSKSSRKEYLKFRTADNRPSRLKTKEVTEDFRSPRRRLNRQVPSYLDLSRTRSDESVLWSAGEEAAAVVAELRASLGIAQTPKDSNMPSFYSQLRSRSYSDLSSSEDSVVTVRPPVPHREGCSPLRRRRFGGSWLSLLKIGGMSVARATVKKVPPPTVPPEHYRRSESSLSSFGDRRTSFSSLIGDDVVSPTSPRSPSRGKPDPNILGMHRPNQNNNESPSPRNHGQFTFPPPSIQVPQFAHLMCPKTSPGSPHHNIQDNGYTYFPSYHTQTSLEDQGIDMQSPGRSSPGSGSGSSSTGSTVSSGNCRNSTTSLDSGRASSSTHTLQHRLSGQSYDSNQSMRHSYHSSSSSIGSLEHDGAPYSNIQELINSGVADSEVLRAWLKSLHFEEYYDKFATAGYDMPTISRMTPEDLNAIGITKPLHRKKFKSEISKLNISDGLPDRIPKTLEEWLTLLRLEDHIERLRAESYFTVEQMTQLTWEDLEDIGIKKLGHQKKVMLAIKRTKDIMSGKKPPDSRPMSHYPCPPPPLEGNYQSIAHVRPFVPDNRVGRPMMDSVGNYINHSVCNGSPYKTYNQCYINSTAGDSPYHNIAKGRPFHYTPDVVAVQVRPVASHGYTTEPIYGTCKTFLPLPLSTYTSHPPHRSLDDGDITPTNEISYEGGGTLPRPRGNSKLRPVAKVVAKTRVDVHEAPSPSKSHKDIPLKVFSSVSTNNTPQGTPKKLPPPPPKRSNSVTETSMEGQYSAVCKGLINFKGNLQPDVTPDMPPPPPAPQDSGNHQHLPDDMPPPPPPLTCLSIKNAARGPPSVSSGGTAYNSTEIHSPFRTRRNDSISSYKSSSSTDSSDSLPFANDNAGTIKQKLRGTHLDLLETRSPRSSPHSSPAVRRKDVVMPSVRNHMHLQSNGNAFGSPAKCKTKLCQDTPGDVLSDIGNMLANLTDELDAMLEQELTIKN